VSQIAREYSDVRFRPLPAAEAVSGNPIVHVINGNTSIWSFTSVRLGFVGNAPVAAFSSVGTAYSVTLVTYDSREQYDPELVSAIKQADAAKPEATFTNVIDMMEWLERD
jgi:hypothetical protein